MTGVPDTPQARPGELPWWLKDAKCSCDIGPNTTGPEEDCPIHGRAYWDWIEYGERMQARATAAEAQVAELLALLAEFVHDNDDCWFDHHGDCQAHGWHGLQRREDCGHARAKRLLAGTPGGDETT